MAGRLNHSSTLGRHYQFLSPSRTDARRVFYVTSPPDNWSRFGAAGKAIRDHCVGITKMIAANFNNQ